MLRVVGKGSGLTIQTQQPDLVRILAAATESERPVIVERSRAGRLRCLSDWEAGLPGKTVHNWSGKARLLRIRRSWSSPLPGPLGSVGIEEDKKKSKSG
jgi:hypothetical protein